MVKNNPPTETVSDKKIRKSIKFMASEGCSPESIVFAHGQIVTPDERDFLLEYEKKTKIKPTVEKWEKYEDEVMAMMTEWQPGNFTVCPECHVDDWTHSEGCKYLGNDIIDRICKKIAHSVQEAKAEGFREGYERAKRELQPKYGGQG